MYKRQTITSTIDAEYIRDTIGAALVQGAGTILSVNDTANTITYSVDPEFIRDTIGTALSGTTGVEVVVDDAGDTIQVKGDPEYFRDLMGLTLVQGTGVIITVDDAANTITISADGSTTIPFIYAPAVYYPGTMKTSGVVMMRHTFVEDCSLPADFDGSQGGAEIEASVSTVYKVQRSLAASPNTFVDIGSITYGTSSTVPTFATAAGVDYTFSIGDTMRVVGPDVPDATLSDTNFTFRLLRIS